MPESSLLVWIKPQAAGPGRFQPGEVVDVQEGEFDFGKAIAEIGWWRVIVCDAPASVTRGFLTGDLVDPLRPDAPRRERVRKLDIWNLPARCDFESLWNSSIDVPPVEDLSVIGQPYNVLG